MEEQFDTGIFSQFFNNILSKSTIFDTIVHSPEYTGRIFHRFFHTYLRSGRAQIGGMSTLIIGSHFKSTTGTG